MSDDLKSKDFPGLSEDEIHIWSAYLPSYVKDISCFETILSEDEREKAYHFKFTKDQEQFILSRGILRCLLGEYLGVSPENVEIIYGLWGKPHVLTDQSLFFNISHSKDYVLYAVVKNYEVGIDLEYRNPKLDIEDMALNVFSPQKLRHWKNIHPANKMNTFFKYWTCKEAFLKASGKGWLGDFQTHFEGMKDFNETKHSKEENEKMTFPHYFEIIPEYASALFIEGPFLRLIYYNWNSHKLKGVFLCKQQEPV